jgi:predicted esterase
MVFHPNNNNYDPDIVIEYAAGKDHKVPSILHSQPTATKYIVFAHGNGANIYTGSDFCKCISDMNNVNVIIFEYPEYSVCEGKLSEQSCYNNLDHIISHMQHTMNIDTANIYLVGQSLGTAIVADYAANNNWSSPIMLISPFTTITSVVLGNNNMVGNVLKRIVDMFETVHKVDKITCPVKIVHGKKDVLVNINHGKLLHSKLKNKMEPDWVPNADHNNIGLYLANNKEVWDSFLV